MVEEARRAKKSFFAHLALIAALWQIGVRLATGVAFNPRIANVMLHCLLHGLYLSQRGASGCFAGAAR